jgi:CxxC-x17-CxxC domain-containing protein
VYEDKTITCADCGQPFTFTASEQAFYAEKGFSDAPKRCKSCRQARKQQRSSSSSSYGSDSYGGGGSSYGGGGGYSSGGYGSSSSSSYDRAPRQMYDAVCADCGRTAQVPFQPTGSRPVYCNDCFRARR